jgi:PhoH-like ATPase
MSSILLDTNLLLDDPTIIFKLQKTYDKIVIPITVLKELDKHKNNPDLAYSARQAINAIREFKDKYPDIMQVVVDEDDMSTNDLRIIRAAKDSGAIVATKDISMSIIAESKGVQTKVYGNVANGMYEPYLTLKIEDMPGDFEYAQLYNDKIYDKLFNLVFNDKGYANDAWFFIFIVDGTDTVAVYANNVKTQELERIDNIERYRVIQNREKKVYIKAKDHYQICAIFALTCADNVLITGKWGSGKSLLATAYAIAKNDKKTFISRPPLGIDARYNIGFLPGDVNSKLESWAMGFLSAVYYIYGNTMTQETSGDTFDFVKEEIFQGLFELIDINSLQGLSLLDDFLLVDEIQLCTVDLISAIMSRATDESKLVLTGDLAQSYSVKPSNSGLLKLLRALPHKSMAYVPLKNSYRSDLLELAEKLQDKTF